MDDTEILRISYEVAKGLRYLHSAKIVHRDLRSPNVLLTGDDTCKIADFGISTEINLLALKSGKNLHAKLGSNTNSPCVDMALGYLNFTYSRTSLPVPLAHPLNSR